MIAGVRTGSRPPVLYVTNIEFDLCCFLLGRKRESERKPLTHDQKAAINCFEYDKESHRVAIRIQTLNHNAECRRINTFAHHATLLLFFCCSCFGHRRHFRHRCTLSLLSFLIVSVVNVVIVVVCCYMMLQLKVSLSKNKQRKSY